MLKFTVIHTQKQYTLAGTDNYVHNHYLYVLFYFFLVQKIMHKISKLTNL